MQEQEQELSGLSVDDINNLRIEMPMFLLRKTSRFLSNLGSRLEVNYIDLMGAYGLIDYKYPKDKISLVKKWNGFNESEKKIIKEFLLMDTAEMKREFLKTEKGLRDEEQIDQYLLLFDSISSSYIKADFTEFSEITEHIKENAEKFGIDKIIARFYNLIMNDYDEVNQKEGAIFTEFIEILHLASKSPKNVLEITDLSNLIEIFKRIFIKVESEGNKSFLYIKAINALTKFLDSLNIMRIEN